MKTVVLRAVTASLAVGLATPSLEAQSNPMIGQIQYFAIDYCPPGFTTADGREIDVRTESEFQALLAVIGYTYGGNHAELFNLPDLRGRLLAHAGNGPGGVGHSVGEAYGSATVALDAQQVPPHRHDFLASSASPDSASLAGATIATLPPSHPGYAVTDFGRPLPLNEGTVQETGDFELDVQHPYLVLTACIAYQGRFPQRPGSDGDAEQSEAPPASGLVERGRMLWQSIRRERTHTAPESVQAAPKTQDTAGEYLITAANWCPQYIPPANGQTLQVGDDTAALFAFIGSTYSNNQNFRIFNLPNLQGRVPIGPGGDYRFRLGDVRGAYETVLTNQQLRAHRHAVRASTNEPNEGSPLGNYLPTFPSPVFSTGTPNRPMASVMVGSSDQAHPIPLSADTMTVNYCIVVEGWFPLRP